MRALFKAICFIACIILSNPIELIARQGFDDYSYKSFQSPTAYSLGKYGETPVSLYTGVPDISIPITTITGASYSLPISLSYHAGGIKAQEVASWVGLGWSLNAGGVITRSTRGDADDDPYSLAYLFTAEYIHDHPIMDYGLWSRWEYSYPS
ncbi:MAG: hypothetical protein ED557_04155 [Balneola sp.]|nr:MAG: hypothetical protein ED557_04155 [Balneola sp.]